MPTPIIKIDNINLYYDYGTPMETYALRGVNLEINQGEYIVFFGPSGCGKTSLTYLIGGIETEQHSSGKMVVNNHDILTMNKDELAKFRQTGIGIIFQQFNLIPSLNVLDNVALPMAFVGVGLAERRQEAMKILARLEMDKYALRMPSELSGGQQQRVGIARALANNPPIIIADEPLGNLDSENAERVLAFLKELNEKDGRTIIMVTHEAWSVRDAARVVYLKDGAITKMGESIKSQGASSRAPISPGLFRDLYPDLSSSQIMVKSLSNLLLRGFSSDEIQRLEFFLSQRIDNKIDKETFQTFLDKPFHEEGVGLWKQRAIKITNLVEDLLSERKKINDIYKDLESNPEKPLSEEVYALRMWILKEYKGKLDDKQNTLLDQAILERLKKVKSPEEFKRILNLQKSKGGIGLSIRTTQHLSDKLESALALENTKEDTTTNTTNK